MGDNSTCCFCPSTSVDWNRESGLINFNMPCDPKEMNASNWFIEEETNIIRIPDQFTLMPSFLLFIPLFWLHFCIILPCAQASSYKLTNNDHNLDLQLHNKLLCSEGISKRKSKISHAEIEKRSLMFIKQIRLCILFSTGIPPTYTQWIPNNTDTLTNMTCLVTTINNRVIELHNRNQLNNEIISTNNYNSTITNNINSNNSDYYNNFANNCNTAANNNYNNNYNNAMNYNYNYGDNIMNNNSTMNYNNATNNNIMNNNMINNNNNYYMNNNNINYGNNSVPTMAYAEAYANPGYVLLEAQPIIQVYNGDYNMNSKINKSDTILLEQEIIR